ncbi:hypothetical protein DOTSEDRAFT_73516 [Dothistroma septosporum NZE10]|uniref:Uncharacterized protein n=1 Tax=Dothistroma septosporum (strain NZE10 / CBS 128990) TaxID=675120 RepID=N1PMQ0_DOTSN|nr:hypothetical protein DOTSEDRAFT_73516 [Dothistroma septosporum NZE10]
MVFQWAKDWVVDKVYNAASTTIQAGGSMAGNAVGGVGSLIENSGRGVGSSAQGAIGGVGGYINNYGQSIIDATAPSGGSGSAEKKTAVKPSTASKPASKPAVSAQKSASAVSKPKAVTATPASAPRSMPSKPPPPGPQRNLPAKKPAQAFPQRSAGSGLNKIAAGKEDKTPDGKIRVSPASRPQPVKTAGVSNGPVKSGAGSGNGGPKTAVSNGGPRPLPKVSAGKNDRTADGKVRISPASGPRPVVKAN